MSRFFATRAVGSAAAVLVALVEGDVHHLLLAGGALYAGIALLGGRAATARLLGASLTMAAPLALLHGIVNPAYPASSEFLGVPLREEGFRFAMDVSARLSLLFGVLGLWRGTPRRTWLGLVASSRLPPALAVAMLQAIALTHVLAVRITRIRQAQRSRGILRDDMGIVARVGAAAAVVVPLVAITLIDASERGALLHRMGLGSYVLHPATPLSAPGFVDLAVALAVATTTAALILG